MIIYLKSIRRSILGKLRKFLFLIKGANIEVGKNFFCGKNCFVSPKNKISLGKNFYMGNFCHLAANAKIGDDVLFASFVSLVGGDHKIDNINTLIKYSGRDILKTIIIEDNVWVGHGVTIMHGVKIESGAVIAAGSVVTKNVKKDSIVGGNPAKLIRYRKNETDHTRP